MKVLWITNIMLPAPCEALGLPKPVMCGWMYASAQSIIDTCKTIDLAIATVYNGNELKSMFIDGILYYLLPLKGNKLKYHKKLEDLWIKVNNEFKPDIVHIHGSEYTFGLAFQKACPNVKSVISIQGIISIIARYYLGGMTKKEIFRHISFRDFIKRDNLLDQQKSFYKRGIKEKEMIKLADYIIGRTSWDKTHVYSINPNAKYIFINETLRPSFYNGKWEFKKCEAHSIFISQAGYPLKGLHQVIKALPLVLNKFPNAKIYVAGNDITKISTIENKLRISGYGLYIRNLIKKLGLVDKVIFTGPLNEKAMHKQYLKSNVFVCPSSIENSPNSLGEAQILGTPCIASYVGGSPDMIPNNECGLLYRFEEYEMLASNIIHIFETSQDFDNTYMRSVASKRHNQNENVNNLLALYNNMIYENNY